MQAALYIAAIALIALTLWDVFITIFSADGAGPITRFWSGLLWGGLLRIHRRRRIHRLLSLAGPFILLASILLWYVLLGVGLFLVFAAHPDSVVNNNTGLPVDLSEKVYFVSTTISSLGYGDLVPSGFPWTLASTLATLAATAVITVSLSYVLSVLSAAIERRKLAQAIFGLGKTIPDFMGQAWPDGSHHPLHGHLVTLASEIDHQGLKHLAYPILKFFHATNPELSPARALLLLSDSFFILGIAPPERQPPAGVRRLVESSVAGYVEKSALDLVTPEPEEEEEEEVPERFLRAAREAGGLRPGDSDFSRALAEYLPLRARLVALAREDGWGEAS